MVRTPCCDKDGIKKGTWTPDEDKKLIAYVTRYGCWNWRQLPRFAGLKRCGKSCRLRWMNYLRPNIKRGNYTKEEEEIIIRMHKSLGNRWSAIAAKLPGRTDNEIKNHWHTDLKKRVERKSGDVKSEVQPISIDLTSQTITTRSQESEANSVNNPPSPIGTPHQLIESLIMQFPDQPSSSDFSSVTSDITAMTSTDDLLSNDIFDVLDAYQAPKSGGDFWTDPFLGDDSYATNEFWEPLVDFDSPFLDGDMLFSYGFRDHQNGSLNLQSN